MFYTGRNILERDTETYMKHKQTRKINTSFDKMRKIRLINITLNKQITEKVKEINTKCVQSIEKKE